MAESKVAARYTAASKITFSTARFLRKFSVSTVQNSF
jgi:hypothetical protein